jgi:hypothetical protein
MCKGGWGKKERNFKMCEYHLGDRLVQAANRFIRNAALSIVYQNDVTCKISVTEKNSDLHTFIFLRSFKL